MKKMWDGRFLKETNKLLEIFNASINFDKRLYKEDIKGSIAHSKMLLKQGYLSEDEQSKIEQGLLEIEKQISENKFEFKIEDEDIHMSIEKKLIQNIGDIGGKLHTARSRNDQVALDIRLYLRSEINNIINLLLNLQKVIVNKSTEYKEDIIPGYTHLQRAQPILISHHFLAYFQMFKRDIERLEDAKKRLNILPLGAGALAGTTYNIDRDFVAKELGFDSVSENSIDSVSDRDFIIEITSNISIIAMHLSRFSEEIIIWSTSEFNFIKLDDSFSTGSSIMPQKKNPDIPELIRGKTGRIYGNLISILTIMKALPLAYNKDMQEDKEGIFDSIDNIKISLDIFSAMLDTITVNTEHILSSMKKGFLNATDVADYLAKKGIPFRNAHEITGKLVTYCEKNNITLEDLTTNEFKSFSSDFSEDIKDVITIESCVKNRNSKGGTSYEEVDKQIQSANLYIKNKEETYER